MRNILILLAFVGVAHAGDPNVGAARDLVRPWFAGYEFVPTDLHFKKVGPHLGAALASIALDPAEPLTTRARAVSAMVHAPGAVTEPVLAVIAETEVAESILRRKAVEVLAQNHEDKYLDLVATVFINAAADVHLREACARALTAMPGERATTLRAELFAAEKSPLVKTLLAEPKDIVGGKKATPVGDRFRGIKP